MLENNTFHIFMFSFPIDTSIKPILLETQKFAKISKNVRNFLNGLFWFTLWKPLQLTPRCRTSKVPKVGAFSPYLRVTTFWGFEIYTHKYMTLRNFDNFLFFPWILWFLCASLHATDSSKKWCKTKWSRFYINERAFVILTAFCVKKQYFS